MKRSFFYQLSAYSLSLLGLSLLTLVILLTFSFKQFFYQETFLALEKQAIFIQKNFLLLPNRSTQEYDRLCKEIGITSQTRVTFINPQGVVLGDSFESPTRMDNHLFRPEIQQALHSGSGTSLRFSQTLQEEYLYYAKSIVRAPHGFLRVAVPLTSLSLALREIYIRSFILSLVCIGLFMLISFWISRKISQPLDFLQKQAALMAQGETSLLKLKKPSSILEVDGLSQSLQEMSKELKRRLAIITEKQSEEEAFFSSMLEGVVAVDSEMNLLKINQAAQELLNVSATGLGKSFYETVRLPKLQAIVQKTLSEKQVQEEEMTLYNQSEEKILLVHAVPLLKQKNKLMGALLVLNDLTKLKRLENLRQEFVGNVSHELRTPLTAIRGFVETLLEDSPTPQAQKFLAIILKHTQHLQMLIEDLLQLSRLEQFSQVEGLQKEKVNVHQLCQAALGLCQPQALEKDSQLKLECAEDLLLICNPALLEQALVNLLGNAIKYSPPSSFVNLKVTSTETNTLFEIKDNGPGIAKEHLSRLFERFYRISKSREGDGTGLGLAIVKHIALTHGGSISVQSSPGQGTSFSLFIPIQNCPTSLGVKCMDSHKTLLP